MKNIFVNLKYLIFIAVLGLCSCGDDEKGLSDPGASKATTVYVNSEGGSTLLQVKSNGEWTVTSDKSTQKWATLESTSGTGDGSFSIKYKENNSFARCGVFFVKLAKDNIADTIYLKQYGLQPILDFIAKDAKISAFGKDAVFSVNTNFPASFKSAIKLEAVQPDLTVANWITEMALSADLSEVSCKILSNDSKTERQASLKMVYIDNWGDTIQSAISILQAAPGGADDTRVVTFEQLRALIPGGDGSLVIQDNISLAGIVISDCENANVAENPMLTPTTIDYTLNYRTAYLQSADGGYGIAVQTDSRESNLMHRYDHVALWLKGLKLEKKSNPERFLLTGVQQQHYISSQPGNASDLVLKERYIGDLKDQDLYTFVTLKECELPIRKGSFTPINEGYGSAYSATRVDKYPLLLRDIQGNSLFLMTNLSCPYRRDGKALPQGSGSVSGIVVHEKYDRFEKDGNIGTYQIRHMSREDIALAENASDSFSKVIAEWSKYNRQNNLMMASSGSGQISHTSTLYQGTGYATIDYSHLGPISGNSSEDNKGVNSSTQNLAFANTYWWNESKNTGESWVIQFSTKGISSTQLSLQLATFNNAIGAPRYWVAEWCDHGNQSGSWDKIVDYTVPDVVNWDNTLLTQLSGWKNIDIPLPAALLNKEVVYIRLRVSSNKVGTATSYDGGLYKTAANSLSYVSIRYNK